MLRPENMNSGQRLPFSVHCGVRQIEAIDGIWRIIVGTICKQFNLPNILHYLFLHRTNNLMWNIRSLSSKNTGGIFEVAKLMIAFFGHDLAVRMVFNKW